MNVSTPKKHNQQCVLKPAPRDIASKPAPRQPTAKPYDQPQNNTKHTPEDGQILAYQRFAELQESLQEVFGECNELWHEIPGLLHEISDLTTDPRKSWRSGWGHLQVLLKAKFQDIIEYKEAQTLSDEQRSKLGRAAVVLYQKKMVAVSLEWRLDGACSSSEPGKDADSVLQNLIDHIQTLMRAVSDEVCWSRILHEVLCTDDLSEAGRNSQVSLLDNKLNAAQVQMKHATWCDTFQLSQTALQL